MDDRNKLFVKARGILVNEGASKEEATKLVKEQLRMNTRRGSAGGQSGNTPSVTLIDDTCEGKIPSVNNTLIYIFMTEL